jgi:electron transport complex protein RnfB
MPQKNLDRRHFLRHAGRAMILSAAAAATGTLFVRKQLTASCRSGACESCPEAGACSKPDKIVSRHVVWQIDPLKCVQCGQCATQCVLDLSAVKCVHSYSMCGYCKLCFGYFQPGANALTEAAENQICPTGAINRKFVEDPYYQYSITEELCNGCGKCVKGCNAFGNGSLHLQVSHDLCLNCNECAIARACPADAFERVPVDKPYKFKHEMT